MFQESLKKIRSNANKTRYSEQLIEVLGSYWPILDSLERGAVTSSLTRTTYQAINEAETVIVNEKRLIPSHTIIFLITYLANIADDICESSPEILSDPDTLLSLPMIKGQSLVELTQIISSTSQKLGVKINVAERLSPIFSAQIEGIKLVQSTRETGKIAYTLQDGINYRLGTLGRYFGLLADIGIQTKRNRQRLVRNMLSTQADDDMHDLVEDYFSQCNPYLGALSDLGLTRLVSEHDDFIYPTNPLIDNFRKYIMRAYNINNNQVNNLTIADQKIQRSYRAFANNHSW